MPAYDREEGEFGRAIGFIDATFALALTLLVTSLDVDEVPAVWMDLGALFDAVGPQFISFLIAFWVIAKYWLAHHRLIAKFNAIDQRTIIVNLFLVGAIVLLPFSTRAVGDPAIEDLPLPQTVMAVNVTAASILTAVVYLTALRRGLFTHAPSRKEINSNIVHSTVPAVVFLLSIPLAYLVSPAVGRWFWFLLIPIGILTGRIVGPSDS
jgi:uncharacterized membrane protein